MKAEGYNKAQIALVNAVRLLIKPLIRLLIEKGVTFPQFREFIKELYVEVASDNFSLDDKRPSDSRIFVLTGVHRKDIKRLRERDSDSSGQVTSSASLSAEIVARWTSMPDFIDDKGRPRQLARSDDDKQAGFDSLVASVSKDVRPRVVLDEWLRLGIVRMQNEYIVLNRSAFVTNKEFKEMAYYLGHNVHDHIASCVNNILVEDEPMLERSVYYSSLTLESANKLRSVAREKGEDLLQQLNKQAIKLYDRDKGKQGAVHRIRLGVYWYQKKLDAAAEHEK